MALSFSSIFVYYQKILVYKSLPVQKNYLPLVCQKISNVLKHKNEFCVDSISEVDSGRVRVVFYCNPSKYESLKDTEWTRYDLIVRVR